MILNLISVLKMAIHNLSGPNFDHNLVQLPDFRKRCQF